MKALIGRINATASQPYVAMFCLSALGAGLPGQLEYRQRAQQIHAALDRIEHASALAASDRQFLQRELDDSNVLCRHLAVLALSSAVKHKCVSKGEFVGLILPRMKRFSNYESSLYTTELLTLLLPRWKDEALHHEVDMLLRPTQTDHRFDSADRRFVEKAIHRSSPGDRGLAGQVISASIISSKADYAWVREQLVKAKRKSGSDERLYWSAVESALDGHYRRGR